MKIKDEYAAKYHYNIYQKLKSYPSDLDFTFDIYSLIIKYNNKKRRKKLKPEFSRIDFIDFKSKLSDNNKILFDEFYETVKEKYNIVDDPTKDIIVIDDTFIKMITE